MIVFKLKNVYVLNDNIIHEKYIKLHSKVFVNLKTTTHNSFNQDNLR